MFFCPFEPLCRREDGIEGGAEGGEDGECRGNGEGGSIPHRREERRLGKEGVLPRLRDLAEHGERRKRQHRPREKGGKYRLFRPLPRLREDGRGEKEIHTRIERAAEKSPRTAGKAVRPQSAREEYEAQEDGHKQGVEALQPARPLPEHEKDSGEPRKG